MTLFSMTAICSIRLHFLTLSHLDVDSPHEMAIYSNILFFPDSPSLAKYFQLFFPFANLPLDYISLFFTE